MNIMRRFLVVVATVHSGVGLGVALAVATGVAVGIGVGTTTGVELGLGVAVATGVAVGVGEIPLLPPSDGVAVGSLLVIPADASMLLSKNCLFSPKTHPVKKRGAMRVSVSAVNLLCVTMIASFGIRSLHKVEVLFKLPIPDIICQEFLTKASTPF